MNFKLFITGLLILALINSAHSQTAVATTHPKAAQITAFININVVPMDKEQVLERQTVIIRDGRISEIGSAATTKVPKDAMRIDGRGKYLMPGLVDMHTHLYSQTEMPLYIANGVTTVFNLDGRPAHLLWRERIARGEMLAATIYTVGPKFDRARTPEEAARIVDEQARAGYDGIKIYNQVSKEEYPALMAAARRNNLIIVGHIPRKPGFEAALKAGQAIAHAEEYIYAFFNNDVGDIDKIELDESRIAQAVTLTRTSGIWITPTLVTYDYIVRQASDLGTFLAKPELKYIAPSQRERFSPENNRYKRAFNSSQVAKLKEVLAFQKKLLRALHKAGVPILVGTDAPDVGPIAGFSIHEELRNLVESGFTPFKALQAATRDSAQILKSPNEFGTVSVGKRADLILLEANPLKDIGNVARRVGVMVRGQWLPESELRGMLDNLPAAYAKEEQFVRINLKKNVQKALQYLDENDPFNQLSSAVLINISLEQGTDKLKNIVGAVKKVNPNATLIQERTINALGYRLLGRKKMKEAIEIFRLNVEIYPKSANTYDSLAEAHMTNGNKELAVEFYKKALEVDPKYPNAQYAIEFLKKSNQ